MKSREKGIDTFKQVLARLSRGEIVQNRQLKTVLGAEGYARYLSDCEYQQYLRLTVKNKPDEILGYERRLKAATFAYSKVDYRSQKGHRFERLSDHLSENIVGHAGLEAWFDRLVATRFADS